MAVEKGGFAMAWIGSVDKLNNKVIVVESAGITKDYLKKINIDLKDKKRGGGPTGLAVKTGKHVISNNIEEDKKMIPWRKDAIKYGYKSSVSFPIKVLGKVVGSFTLYSSQKCFFNDEEIKLLDEMVMDVSFALEFIEQEKTRKNAEDVLRQSEQRFQTLTEISPVGIFQTDAKGFTLYVNSRWCQISGLSKDQAMGNGWLSAVHHEDKEKLGKGWKRATLVHEPSQAEYRFVQKDGTIVWVLGQATPERNNKNKIIGYIGTITDITFRKHAEQQIQESVKQLRTLVEGTKALLFTTDNRGRFTYSNQAGSELLDISSDQLLGSFYLRLVHPDDRKRVHQQYLHQLANAEENSYLEFRFIGKNKKVGWLSFSVNTIVNNGKIIGLTGVAQDITERKRAEE
ncbi:MAG: PAS domain S-box protein, partial [Ignavibacteria bacterium]|nr:PAS domain S-box protein [Ignavibacteria bacterium]